MKKDTVEISVLMSLFNEPLDWIEESINSILNQTFSSFELILINDNPSNIEIKKLLKSFEKDDRINIISNTKNLGLTKSLNIGLKACRGKYIARMDADDICSLDRLQTQHQFMEKNKDHIACGSFIETFGELNVIDNLLPRTYQEFEEDLLVINPLPHPTAFIRSEAFKIHLLCYNEDFKYAQDYQLWSELIRLGKISLIPKPLLKYRISKNQISNQKKTSQGIYANKIREKLLKTYIKNATSKKKTNWVILNLKNTRIRMKLHLILALFLTKTKINLLDTLKIIPFLLFVNSKKKKVVALHIIRHQWT